MRMWILVFASRFRGWLRNSSLEEDFDTEIQAHLALLTDEHVRRGLTPEEAARAARVTLGGLTQLKEDQRSRRGFPLLGALWQDSRYAMRMFSRSPGFTVVAVLTIAIGVGVNTVVFTLLDAVAFKPLPVSDAGNLVRIKRSFQSGARGDVQYAFSVPEYLHYRSHSQRLSSIIAAGWPEDVVYGDGGQTWRGQVVSDDYFTALGVRAALGRTFLPEENRAPGAAPVIVIADGLWRRHFHADAGVIGRTIALNGTVFTVIGVAPAQFIGTGNPPLVPDFWAPLMMQGQLTSGAAWLDRPDTHRLQLLARINPHVSRQQARAELDVLTSQLAELPETHSANDRTISLALQPAVYFGGTDDVRFAAFVGLLMATVSMILFVACANLANMLLARGARRHREIGVRLALGASRGRIVRQLLTESLLLAGLGGAAGLLFSAWGSQALWSIVDRLVRIMFLTDRSFVTSVAPDERILIFTLAVSIATGLLFGLSPALRISRSSVTAALKDDAPISGDGLRPSQSWLIGGQMAVSMAFLICAGLLLKGLVRAQQADTGFDTSRVFMIFMNPGTDRAAAPTLQKRTVQRLILADGIQDVALVDRFPFSGTWSPPVIVDEPDGRSGGRSARTLANYVSASYFQTMGIPLVAGRTFTRVEEERGNAVAVLSESAARDLWPNENPLGKRLKLDMTFRGNLAGFEVVGVARDVRSANLSRVDPAYVYLPTRSDGLYNLLIRSDRDPPRVSASVVAAVEAVDRRLLPSVRVMRMSEGPFLRVQLAIPRAAAPLTAGLALVALILAGIGIYGVTSYVAGRRIREIGIRMALGATAGDVRLLMLRHAMTPVLIGGGLGVAAAGALSRLLQTTLSMPSTPDYLFGVGAFDPATFAGASAFALLVAAAASYIPARRATRVDPLVALRYE